MNGDKRELFDVYSIWGENPIYGHFSPNIFYYKDDEIDQILEKTIKMLKKKQNEIKKLKETSIVVLKEDLEPKVFESLVNAKISNMYELSRNICKTHFHGIYSKIPNVAEVKGKKIIEAMKKHKFPDSVGIRKVKIL